MKDELTNRIIGAAIEVRRHPVGRLVNFNVPVLKNRIKRLVNNYERPTLRLCVSAVNKEILPCSSAS